MAAAREHALIDALAAAGIRVMADSAYPRRRRERRSAPTPPSTRVRPRRAFTPVGEPESGQLRARPATRPWRTSQRPAQKLESAPPDPNLPRRATLLVNAVQTLIHAG